MQHKSSENIAATVIFVRKMSKSGFVLAIIGQVCYNKQDKLTTINEHGLSSCTIKVRGDVRKDRGNGAFAERPPERSLCECKNCADLQVYSLAFNTERSIY